MNFKTKYLTQAVPLRSFAGYAHSCKNIVLIGLLSAFTGPFPERRKQEAEDRYYETKVAKQKQKRKNIEQMTLVTEIRGGYICYSGEYYGAAIEIPAVEFRFFNSYRRTAAIDTALGSVIRNVGARYAANLVKIERPLVLDEYIDGEYDKIAALKRSYERGVFSEEELKARIEIVYDRINQLRERNTRAFLAEETQNYSEASVRKRRYPAYAAACACLLLALLGGRWLYFTPTAEISIDINPSIELSVNRFDRVIGINAFNKDGWTLSNGLDIKYRNCTQAVEQILRHENVAALLSGDEVMTITVVGPDGRQSAKLLSDIETCIAGQGNIDCYFARPDEVANAHEAGLSCGKYRAFLELQLLDPDITPEAVQGMTMREIRDLIARLTPDDDNGSSPSSSRGNSPHDYGGGHGGRRHGRNG